MGGEREGQEKPKGLGKTENNQAREDGKGIKGWNLNEHLFHLLSSSDRAKA